MADGWTGGRDGSTTVWRMSGRAEKVGWDTDRADEVRFRVIGGRVDGRWTDEGVGQGV